MTDRITSPERGEAFVQHMTDQMATLARTLRDWVQAETRSLQQIEEQLVRVLHDVGSVLLASVLPLAAPTRPCPDVACPCGHLARYQRMRPARITTLLGPVSLTRAVYACPHCGASQAPLDRQLQVAAGGLRLGLQELLALLGATQDSFVQATDVLARLCLVQVCPNSTRAATEDLGAGLAAHDQARVTAAQQTQTPPAAASAAPARLYISMDGVLAHIHAAGWKELKTGCVYTTRRRAPREQPEQVELRAEAQRYVTALADADTFGWQLWAEACRRGVSAATERVVTGDGAHWIWNLANEHFPQATQIVDCITPASTSGAPRPPPTGRAAVCGSPGPSSGVMRCGRGRWPRCSPRWSRIAARGTA